MGILSWRLAAATTLLALALVGCGYGSEPAAPGYGNGRQTPQSTVAVEDSILGQILVDAKGNTLYAFTVDSGGKSACYDGCARDWPALIIGGGELRAAEGVDQSLLGTAERTDGSTQVTYAGMPLYHFAGDAEPGDVNGQGLGDVWFVVSPEGHPVLTAI